MWDSLKKFVLALTIFPLVVFSFSFALAQTPNSRIVGGSGASEFYPFMAALIPRNSDPSRESVACGAVLIHPKFVLTAAHCVSISYSDSYVELIEPKAAQVVLGKTRLTDSSGEIVDVSRILLHPNHDVSSLFLRYDFALVELAHEVSYPVLNLASSMESQLLEPDHAVRILGWGAMDPNIPVLPDLLQEADIRLASDTTCDQMFGLSFQAESMICAGILASSPVSGDGVDSCSGDSGGPLLVEIDRQWKLLGITSFGFGCASDKYLGVYARVEAASAWIGQILNFHSQVFAPLEGVRSLLQVAYGHKLKKPSPSASENDIAAYEAEYFTVQQAQETIQSYISAVKLASFSDTLIQTYSELRPGSIVRLETYLRRLSRPHLKSKKRRNFLRKAERLLGDLLS